jgi:outer membrane protein assembly factor BamA
VRFGAVPGWRLAGKVLEGVALLAVVAGTPRVEADEGSWGGYKGLPVASVVVQGVSPALASELKAGLELAKPSGRFRGDPAVFFGETLERDVARARLFLARHGYPHADVTPDVVPTADRRRLRITFRVTPGDAVRIRSVRTPGLPDDIAPGPLPAAPGDPLVDSAVQGSGDELARRLRGAGHAFAEVNARVEAVDSTHVDVVLDVNAGPRYRVGAVHVDGAPPDLEPLVRSAVHLREGEAFTPDKLQAAEAAVRELDLFRLVRIGVEPMAGDRLLVQCQVAPRAPRSLGAGIGYYDDDGIRLDAEWRHRNLLRGGRGVALGGRASRFLQTVRTDLTWPRVAGTSVRGILGAAVRHESEDAYDLLDTRVDLTARYRAGRHDWVTAGAVLSYISVDVRTADPGVLDDPIGIVTSVPLTWTHDTFDDPVYPTRGGSIRVRGEFTPGGLGSVVEYARLETQVAGRHPLFGLGLAGRVLFGVARPYGPSRTLFASRRFFSGGSRSMRGFGRRQLGPHDSEGDPLGGEAKAEASVEGTVPLFWRLEAAAFLDAGQVWAERASVRLDTLAWAAGPALLVRTPVGPARLDWGILLREVAGEPRSVVHLSVGRPY